MQYNYDFKEYCFITHNTQISQTVCQKCKIATNTTLQEQIYIQRKLHVEHFLKNTDCKMVAFWQENTLNNRSHVALAGKELSGVVAVD